MATIILQAAGAFLGGAFGSVGAAIGSAAGAVAGYTVDRALIGSGRHYEGPRLSAARPFTAEEGAPIPRVYGTVRTGGTLIWATRFEEESTTTRQGAKGGPKTTTYSYYANAAFALCEGEIAGVRRIWADGREIDRERAEIRVYHGTETQPSDPLIEAKQGEGNAPAYRGTAYVVIERFPIDDYGRRLPQLQFEVLRPVGELHRKIRSVALIPGSTEYGLSPTAITRRLRKGETESVNRHVLSAESDFEASLDELQMLCPNLESVSLVVSWFGNDLRAGECLIRPMVTQPSPQGFSQDWVVSGVARAEAPVVSKVDGGAAYGGTPSDASVKAAIAAIRARGLKVTLYPFMMMDIAADNTLPNPYGGAGQPAYPWRGRITCYPAPGLAGTVDGTATARQQVAAFCGNAEAGDWGYRRFILHYAHLAASAGGVDGFLLGSELRGLTTLRDEDNRFAFVEALQELTGEVRGIIGPDALITYGADWSEYFGHQPADGSGDVFFHLDPLWAEPEIGAIGIDNYMPLSDWRDADYAGGNPDGFSGPYDAAGLNAGVASGEGFDWYYVSAEDRNARRRTPISDGAYGKDWVFRYKDIAGWWSNRHYDRVGGVEMTAPTGWVPGAKPVIFTELGCAAVDKGPNQPNVFPDPKSSENALPYFSNGGRSDLAQHRFLTAHYEHWEAGDDEANPVSPVYGGRMVDTADICLWAWDARAFPAFPLRKDVWSDGDNWWLGHWLNGRLSGVAVGDLINAILADQGLAPAGTECADGALAGYVIDNPATARAALQPIAELFGLGAHEGLEGLEFITLGATALSAYEPQEIVLGDERHPSVQRTREPDNSLPKEVHLDFRDPLNGHQSATAEAMQPGAAAGTKSFVGFPGVMPAGEAQGLAADWLRRKREGRERVAFAVPMTEFRPEPGELIRLPGGEGNAEYVVTEVEDGLTRSIKGHRILRAAPARWAPEQPVLSRNDTFVVGPPMALLLDLPMSSGSRTPEEQLRVAARARPWHAQALLASPEESGFELRGVAPRRATIGLLAEALEPGGFEGRIDQAGTILVELLDGELSSVSQTQLLNGANAAAIRTDAGSWEIVQFRDADEIGPSLWRLTALLRGQLGTSDAMTAGAAAGAAFVLLDAAVQPAGLRTAEIGLELNWRIGPQGYDVSDTYFTTLSARGGERALLPLSPVHLNARPDGAGGLGLSWIRRGRIDADSWLAEEIPLGEETETYRVDIATAEGTVIRSETVSEPRWTYKAADIAADFAVRPETLDVTVRQMSMAVGPGMAASASFPLT